MDPEQLKRIEAFLDGAMSQEERVSFLSQMEKDDVLAEEVAFQFQLIQGLKASASNMDKERLKSIWREVSKEQNVSTEISPIWRYPVGIAAVIIFLVALGISLTPSRDIAVGMDTFFEPYPMRVTRSGNGSVASIDLLTLQSAYGKGDYVEALTLLTGLPDSVLPQNERRFYRGVSYLALDSLEQASLVLEDLLARQTPWDEHARWYLALTFWKQGKDDSSLLLLKEILITPRHFQQENAKALFKILMSKTEK